VRVIAATFKDQRSANRTLEVLQGAFDLGDDDAETAPLGVAGTDSSDSIVLAGRFREGNIPVVCELVEHNGGNVVVDIDEALTSRRVALPVGPGLETQNGKGRSTAVAPTMDNLFAGWSSGSSSGS
jgi:hypothetical protein